ncbi:pepsin/retropepsin-like aspartic protease family protein [Lutibacter citreus]|uniref:hypothetical protein n=1 Tax=Lutibacter citreus TaxID=2138210 RepID=UPI000DBE852D|nr:hypothetical protein [Lutibacter citreus]
MIKKILQIILGILTVFLFLIVTATIFNLAKLNLSIDKIYIGAILSLIFVLFFKKHKVYFITTIITSLLFIGNNFYENYLIDTSITDYNLSWKSKQHSTTIPFYTSERNLIFIKGIVNNKIQYLLFDTGASNPYFKEKFNKKYQFPIYKVNVNSTDANNISKKLNIGVLNKLSIGNLNFKDVNNGHFITTSFDNNRQIIVDSIAGVFSSNLMNSLVWDFNMKNQTIKITDQKFSEKNIEMISIPLIEYGTRWKIDININEKSQKALFDTGANSILDIKDNFNLPENYNYIIENAPTVTSMHSNGKDKNIQIGRKIFVDLGISDTVFKDSYATDKSHINLIGNPLMWEYERVVLDFINKRMYLLNKNNSTKTKSISNISEKLRLKLIKKTI